MARELKAEKKDASALRARVEDLKAALARRDPQVTDGRELLVLVILDSLCCCFSVLSLLVHLDSGEQAKKVQAKFVLCAQLRPAGRREPMKAGRPRAARPTSGALLARRYHPLQ